MPSKLCNRTGGYRTLSLDDLTNAFRDIGERSIALLGLLDRRHEVGHNMGRDLHVGLHQSAKERQQRFEGRAGKHGGVRDGVQVREDIALDLDKRFLG